MAAALLVIVLVIPEIPVDSGTGMCIELNLQNPTQRFF